MKEEMNNLDRRLVRSNILIAGLLIMAVQSTQAAPGVLEDKPLFTISNVQSNIMIITDDSGSMDFEVLITGEGNGVLDGEYWVSANIYLDYTPDDPQERRLHCAGYNNLAYNPSINYTPWKGKDDEADEYINRDLTSGCTNPYDQSSCTNDLSSYYYWVWTDSNGNGDFDTGECGNVDSNDCAGTADCITINSLADRDKTNYANWFSYYRKRQYVAKRALTDVVENSQERVGLRTLNNNNAVNTDITDIDIISKDPGDTDYAAALANKENLLNKIANIGAAGGTPLRNALAGTGALYEAGTPIQYSCQQNFSFLVTDGYWNGSDPALGGVINADGDNNTDYDARSYADAFDIITLADVAMHYYERDLSALDNDVPPNSTYDDLNEAQHMVTYTMAFGLDGALTSNPPNRDDAFTWPQPIANLESTIDDLRHAAWNGRGQFLSAKDPDSVVTAINNAFADIRGRASSAAAVAFNSNTLGANSALYLAIFDSSAWTGNLLAYKLDGSTGDVSSTPDWDASQLLNARDWTTRSILTYKREANNAGSTGVAFKWDTISTAMQNDLDTNSDGTKGNGVIRLDFLRGNISQEGFLFRDRESLLGDIVHSAPVFVGTPEMNWPSPSSVDISRFPHKYDLDIATQIYTPLNTYRKYKEDQADRQGLIYVGANDGMLHAFNADTGHEVMAYVPDYVTSEENLEGLHYLTNKNYRHRYYVDLSSVITDVFDENDGTDGKWKTILVGGGGAGGRGIFALDVTDPDNLTEANANDVVLWEFSNKDYANLGYTLSEPVVVPLQWNADPANEMDVTDKLKWAVIFGNGYNSYDTDTAVASTTSGSFEDDYGRNPKGEAELIILFLDADLSDGWDLGTDYLVISTGKGSTDGDGDDNLITFNGSDTNGLSSPAVLDILGSDRIADRVYVGDLLGNMWVFDLSEPFYANKNSYGLAYADPLFTAKYAVPEPSTEIYEQPITTRPSIIRNTLIDPEGNEPNVVVLFGTGQYLTTGDINNTQVQSVYGIWDNGEDELERGDLLSYTISQVTKFDKDLRITGFSNDDLYSSYNGWSMDLPTAGERVVTRTVPRGPTLFFNTTIPDSEACHAGGSGWLMSVNALLGGEPDNTIFDINDDDDITKEDMVNDGTQDVNPIGERFSRGIPTDPSFLGDKQYTPGSKTGSSDEIDIRDVEHLNDDAVNRVSWQEIDPSTGQGFK